MAMGMLIVQQLLAGRQFDILERSLSRHSNQFVALYDMVHVDFYKKNTILFEILQFKFGFQFFNLQEIAW